MRFLPLVPAFSVATAGATEIAILSEVRPTFAPEHTTRHANATEADLLVSMHASASPNRSASGIETYCLSNTNDRATMRLAHMENHLFVENRAIAATL